MLSDADIYRAAHLMLDQYGDDAEFEAARMRQRPPWSRRPSRLRRPEPPPMTKTRTGGSSSTPLASPLSQRSNQRRRNSKKSSARFAIDLSGGAKFHLTGMAQRAVAMGPRPKDQLHPAALYSR